MISPFYYLAGILLLMSYPVGIEPLSFAERGLAPWAFLGSLALYAPLCWAILARPSLNRPMLAREVLRIVALLLYAELIYIFHLPLWIWDLGVENEPLVSTILGLLPLAALFGILAVVYNKVEPGSGGLRFSFRMFLGLSFLPILLMLGIEEAFERLVVLQRTLYIYPAAGWMLTLGSLALMMTFLPPVLRLILAARPLEPGPLRDRLERRCVAAGFPNAVLLVVPTGTSRLANAFVAGLSARWRYVFFTESLLRGMSPEELECVLVHEVTHARKRHLLVFLIVALAFSLILALAQEALEAWRVPTAAQMTLMLAWTGVYWGGVFGYMSRRFETEADLVAARTVPPVEGGLAPYAAARQMAAALERVAVLNHVPIRAWSWRHFNIEKRIDILVRSETDPSVGAGFERFCDRARSAAVALLLAGLLCGGVLIGIQHGRASQSRAILEAFDAVERGRVALAGKRYAAAREELLRGIDGGADTARARIWLADCERALGNEDAAQREETVARRKGVTDPRLRLRLK